MPRIYIQNLNPYIKKNIKEHNYTIKELEQIKEQLDSEIQKKKKVFQLVIIISVCITALLLITTIGQTGFNEAMMFVVPAIILAIIIVLVICWFAGVGMLKIQYNQVLKKSYPDYYEELRL